MNRSVEKQQLLTDYANRQTEPPISIVDDKQLSQQALYTPVRISGQWVVRRTILLDNQHWQQRTGVLVLTPFRLDSGGVVMINRGFVPLTQARQLSQADRQAIMALPSSATISVTGVLWTWPEASLTLSPIASDMGGLMLWSNLVPEQLATDWPDQAFWQEGVVLLSESSKGGFLRRFEPINKNFGPEKHIAYAIQWFSFAGIIVLLWLAFFWRRWTSTPGH